jgi:hypothetical protein
MHKIGDFIKTHVKKDSKSKPDQAPLSVEGLQDFPTKRDILRYRKQRGLNLGTPLSTFWNI